MIQTTSKERRELIRAFRKVAEDKVEEILEAMPAEAQATLLRRSVVRHLMDGSCHLKSGERVDHMIALVRRLKHGELNMSSRRRIPT